MTPDKPTESSVARSRNSARVLGIGFLAVALLFVCIAWLRPPLSRDISAFSLSLFPAETESTKAANPALTQPNPPAANEFELTQSELPRFRIDSPGALLVMLIVFLAFLVLVRPGRVGVAAGLLLSVSMAGNAALALNHPFLIEKLDREYEQRQQVAGALMKSPERPVLVNYRNGRVGLEGAPSGDEQRADAVRGWAYLRYGCWLVGWSGIGILLGSWGPLNRRLLHLGGWVGLGFIFAFLVCFSRLRAEFDWSRAENLEAKGQSQEARQALNEALRHFPPLAQLERTWLLAGKLDEQLARTGATPGLTITAASSPEQSFFRAYQLARDPVLARSSSVTPDLPWLISKGPDLSQVLGSVPSDFALMESPQTADVAEFQLGQNTLKTPTAMSYQRARFLNQWQAIAVMDDLSRMESSGSSVIRQQAARLWTDRGLHLYWQELLLTDAGPDRAPQRRRLIEAQSAWQKASQLDPLRIDLPIYLALVQVQCDPDHPAPVEALLAPLLDRSQGLGERVLRADLLDTLGDTYFQAGDIEEARKRYAASFDLLNLSRKHNFRAQRGLGGL